MSRRLTEDEVKTIYGIKGHCKGFDFYLEQNEDSLQDLEQRKFVPDMNVSRLTLQIC